MIAPDIGMRIRQASYQTAWRLHENQTFLFEEQNQNEDYVHNYYKQNSQKKRRNIAHSRKERVYNNIWCHDNINIT